MDINLRMTTQIRFCGTKPISMKNILARVFVNLTAISILIGFLLIISGFSHSGSQAALKTDFPNSGEANSAGDAIYLPLIYNSSEPAFKVNLPYYGGDIHVEESAIIWFGRVTPTENYADVRLGYTDEELYVHVTIFDRLLWYDQSPSPGSLTEWDAVSVYLDQDGVTGNVPDANAYKFVGQLYRYDGQPGNFQAVYRGNGSGWVAESIPFSMVSRWASVGSDLNDGGSDKGWKIWFRIPFTSLGFPAPPPQGDVWGFAVSLHDRDDAVGTFIPDKTLPENMDTNRPGTWGQISFGLPEYTSPAVTYGGEVVIKHGLNGAQVTDGHVGGHTTCGAGLGSYFDNWGNANYFGYEQINIQNQTDVSDWPCFSKYYITFPLEAVPPGKAILSASLQVNQFSHAGIDKQPPAQPSLIQVLTVGEDWDERTLTWNNAPLARENVSRTWVDPIRNPWPGTPRHWDVSGAVAEAYDSNEPLRLALYSADYAQHSGKYFYSSDAGEPARPVLTIVWGNP